MAIAPKICCGDLAEEMCIRDRFGIGDTLCEGRKFDFADFPVFPPERFARVQAKDTMKRKQFVKGILQLTQEGAVQLFQQAGAGMESYIVGTVGALQFEVLEYRLKNEYGVDILMQMQPYEVARWLEGENVAPGSLLSLIHIFPTCSV